MEDLSLHILDIAENSIDAHAATIRITIEESRRRDILVLEIEDDGRGMTEDQMRKALDPFYTTKTTRRFGFGLSLLSEAAKAASGDFSVRSEPGKGTLVRASFQLSHIDAKPLGDIPQTLVTLIMGHPEVDLVYEHRCDDSTYALDTREIKTQLEGLPINSTQVIGFIRNDIKEGLDNVRRQK